MSHVNKIIDADPHFEIDINTRNIKNMSSSKVSLVQYDHNSERFSFTMPRFVEGHDMMECNSVQVKYFSTAKPTEKGLYKVTDLAVCEENEENVCCTWLISQNVTKTSGAIQFLLRFACISEDGTLEYAWHTNPFTGIHVSMGMDNAQEIFDQYADILEQWKKEFLTMDKSDVLMESVKGEVVTIAEISPIVRTLDVKVTGTENPENVTIARCGKNLFGGFENSFPRTGTSVTWTCNDSQEFTINGTVGSDDAFILSLPVDVCIPTGTNLTLRIKHISGTVSGERTNNLSIFVNSRAIIRTIFPESGETILTESVVSGGAVSFRFATGGSGVSYNNYTFKVQLEIGDTATEWEKFSCETYTPNADGTVKVTPLSPVTTLLTDAKGAVIECQYDKDLAPNKADKSEVSNAVKETVSGNSLVIENLSPIVDELIVKVTQSYVDAPVIYKRIGGNLWVGNIKLNSETGKFETELLSCKSGQIYQIFDATLNLRRVYVTFYNSAKEAIQSNVSIFVETDKIVIPNNCYYFKVHDITNYYSLSITMYEFEKYTSVDGIITIPSPFDPVVYLYGDGSATFECTYAKDISKAVTLPFDYDETFTITEEEATASTWKRTLDKSGKPIRLSEIQVDFTVPPGSYTGAQYLYFYSGDESKLIRAAEVQYQHATEMRYIRALVYKIRDSFYAVKAYGWSENSDGTLIHHTYGARMTLGEFFNNPQPIVGLYFVVSGGKPVAGTVVRIRGKKVQ